MAKIALASYKAARQFVAIIPATTSAFFLAIYGSFASAPRNIEAKAKKQTAIFLILPTTRLI
ncbi:uncharacterized protein K441DRAFT_664648, partial [Cenococcum geophilum 1.58]|uniref:uncharacterized protein n=1 Tax=Cenococcum geophilum 1.58 TaxID=794803 RepID=UPI00358ECBB8